MEGNQAQSFKKKGIRSRAGLLGVFLTAAVFLLSSCSISDLFYQKKKTDSDMQKTKETRIVAEVCPEGEDCGQRPKHMSLAEAATRTEEKDGVRPLSTMEIAQKAQPAVVAISTSGLRETLYGTLEFENAGSGVIVSQDGYIVTNNHVISKANQIDVVLASGENYRAELIGTDPNNDIAVIKIDENNLPAAEIGNSDDLLVGELAVAVGNPLGDLQGTVTAGIVSSLGRTMIVEGEDTALIELRNLIQTDAAINSGNSGGGLFNSYGELIGINVAKAKSQPNSGTFVEGLGFAIPSNTATPIINALVNEGYVSGQPTLNIRGSTVTEQMARSYTGRLVPGVLVHEIAPDSAVAEAGLEVGDIITVFAGEEVYSVAQLNLVKNRHKAGEKVSMTINRKGKEMELTFVLDELAH